MRLTTIDPANGRVLARPRSLVALVILGVVATQTHGFQQYQIRGLPEGRGDAADFIRSGAYEIEIAGERFAARASLRPLYDPTGERMRG